MMNRRFLIFITLAFVGALQIISLFADKELHLKEVYAGMFDMGAAIPAQLANSKEAKLLTDHFSVVTPENCMKPEPLHPSEKEYRFASADKFIDFAQKNNLKVNAHTLVWHIQTPEWFFKDGEQTASRELLLSRMKEHISHVCSHFAGKVATWDVVNEALDDKGEFLRKSKWKTILGEDYIYEAFLAAEKADPHAELYYNDYNIDLPEKREKAIKLIRLLKSKNVKLNGIGIQGHWTLDVSLKNIEDSIVAFHNEGLKVMITELDLDVVPRSFVTTDVGTKLTAPDLYPKECPPEILEKQAQVYSQLFALFRKHRDKISRVTFWGLHDGNSWLNKWPNPRTSHPLLWDRELNPKSAFFKVVGFTN